MMEPLSGRDAETLYLFKRRNRLLTAIREHSLCDPEEQSYASIYQHCCDILADAFQCNSVWAGDIDREECRLIHFAASPASYPDSSVQSCLADHLIEKFQCSLALFTEPLYLKLDERQSKQAISTDIYCLVCPVHYRHWTYGFVAIHWQKKIDIGAQQREFIANVIDDIALALFSQDTALRLKIERDFNKEIIDTIEALMVGIRPCGTIVSFNKRAELVTGYKEQEVLEKYWVDVLINPLNRLQFQQLFSEILRGTQAHINFKAPLLTKNGMERYISWHGSIRHDIEKGKVGLVMLGIDETDNLVADRQLHMFTARWEKIFVAIQDPALVVSSDNRIIEANPATCAAAKKRREEVIGHKVCDILHGGHGSDNQCPLEQFIGYRKTRITETELHGLHGTYMLTVSPLVEENGDINATFLLARNLTEEEVVRAEAIRTAQLATVGELASGVAHEINNPINGIINYAQIVLDAPEDSKATENLNNIISESKRIAGIVSNLLDFARRREEILAPFRIEKIVSNSLQLVAHLLKKDGITSSVSFSDSLPALMCNEQQLQQVFLNVISNARYALNMRFPRPCPEKRFEIEGRSHKREETTSVILTFTDHGIGIPHEIQNRLFDPFFSTKPKGEGTGLGLSISYGLIRDHGGFIRVKSKPGEWTKFIIDLPVNSAEEHNDKTAFHGSCDCG